jgi:CIC family chloride channel protein
VPRSRIIHNRVVRSMRPDVFSQRRDELQKLVRRSREVVLLAALTGVVTGLAVRLFELAVDEVYHRLVAAPLWLGAIAPVIGLIIAAIALRTIGAGVSPSTSDEYLHAFHDSTYRLGARALTARIVAAIATLGSGGALGLEGPSLYGGSALGAQIQRRLKGRFRGSDHRTLLVAGAAAGVAAIFKAPATGAIFALEVPYRDDLARRMLLPALVSSATGYFTFVSLSDTAPLLSATVIPIPQFEIRDLFGALAIGVACAIGARAFAKVIRIAKGLTVRSFPIRLAIASVSLIGLFIVSRQLTGLSLSLGAGYEVLREWLFVEADIAVWLLIAVFMIRSMASAATVVGGGVGGVFVPLVVGGAIVGRAVGEVVHPERFTLYTLIGIAAFLGAGYRVPLAAVMFVAETTGRPNFIVPALFAAVAAELVMGDQSITSYQRNPGRL